MEIKICTKCGEMKPLTEFYMIHTGHRAGKYHARCRACQSRYDAHYRAENIERVRETDRQYYIRNKETMKESARQWVASNKSKRREVIQRHNDSHPGRITARGAVNDAVRRGKFPPAWTMVCEECKEAQAKHWHHHKGYDDEYKLDVIALCAACHGATWTVGMPVSNDHKRSKRAKLTKEQAQEIKRRAAQGESPTSIAGLFGVARTTIHSVIHGRSWRDV